MIRTVLSTAVFFLMALVAFPVTIGKDCFAAAETGIEPPLSSSGIQGDTLKGRRPERALPAALVPRYPAREAEGIMAPRGSRSGDRLFTIELDRVPAAGEQVRIHYEIEQPSGAQALVLSVNQYPAAGAYVAQDENTTGGTLSQAIEPEQLRAGKNQFRFRPLGEDEQAYRIRNVYLEVGGVAKGRWLPASDNAGYDYFLLEAPGEQHTKLFRAGQPDSLYLEQAALFVPDCGLAADAWLSLTKLRPVDVPAMDPGLVNVTAGKGGFRFLPHGTLFQCAATVQLPYDEALIPAGYTAEDIQTFYYDEQQLTWHPIPRDSLLPPFEGNEGGLRSYTMHFTDMINGILKVPETPETAAYTPTTLSEIKAADPSSGITLIAPPEASPNGGAAIQYSLTLPAGRAGMMPALTLSYNSEGGGGWLGRGWGLGTPAISVDTRFGVPRYSATQETESYVMDDEQLTPTANGAEFENRTAGRLFYPRVEGAFAKITRHGAGPKEYRWEVQFTNGRKRYYGGTPAGVSEEAVLRDAAGNIGQWALTEERDANDNRVTYRYAKSAGGTGGAQSLYVSSIRYTGHGDGEGPYSVEFVRDNHKRGDASLSARMGFLVEDGALLKQINVNYEGQAVRSYVLHYGTAAFGKTQLEAIAQHDAAGAELARHRFDYYNEVQQADGTYVPYKPVKNWNIPSTGLRGGMVTGLVGFSDKPSVLGGVKSSGMSGGGFVGVGIGYKVWSKQLTVGPHYHYSGGTAEGMVAFVDINGDGMPDQVMKDGGALYYSPNISNVLTGQYGFGAKQRLIAPGGFSASKTKTNSFGVGAFSYASVNYTRSSTNSTTDVYFEDFNSDGLLDIAFKGMVYFNRINPVTGHPEFYPYSLGTPAPISGNVAIDPSLLPDPDVERQQLMKDNPLHDVVRVWEAPYNGRVTIHAPVRLLEDASAEAQEYSGADGVTVMVQYGSAELWRQTIPAGDYTEKAFDRYDVNVSKGARLYFRVNSRTDGMYDRVAWAPEITYTQINGELAALVGKTDANGKAYARYAAQEDFVISGAQQTGLPKDGKVRIRGNFRKPLTSDDVRVLITRTDTLEVTDTLFNRLYPRSQAVDTLMDFEQEVHQNDMVEFAVQAATNVDWAAIVWAPRVYYIFFADGSDLTDPYGQPLLDAYPVVDYSILGHLQAGALPYTAPCSREMAFVPIVEFASGLTDTLQGEVVFSVKGRNNLYFREKYAVAALGEDGSPLSSVALDTVRLQVDEGDELYMEYHVPDRHFAQNIDRPLWTQLPDSIVVVALDSVQHCTTEPDTCFLVRDPRGLPDGTVAPFCGADTDCSRLHDTLLVCKGETIFVNFGTDTVACGRDTVLYCRHDTLAAALYTAPPEVWYGPLYRGWGGFGYDANEGRDAQAIDQRLLGFRISDLESMPKPEDMTNPEDMEGVNLPLSDSKFVIMLPEGTGRSYTGYDHSTWFTGTEISSSRRGLKDMRVDEMPEVPAGGLNSMSKVNVSNGNSFSAGLGNGQFGMGNAYAYGTSETHLDMMDLNGDGYPDVLSKNTVFYSLPAGGREYTSKNIGLDIHKAKSETAGSNVNGSPKIATFEVTGAAEKIQKALTAAADIQKIAEVSIGFAGDFGSGSEYVEHAWIDINGDGLPDKVDKDGNVRLNLGYSFTPPIAWGHIGVRSGTSWTFGGGLGFSTSYQSITGGVGVSGSDSKANYVLADVNGDGLPDMVFHDVIPYGNAVRLNTGTGFASPVSWTLPFAPERTTSTGESANTSVTFGFPIFWGLKLVVTPSFAASKGVSREKTRLADISGTGYPGVLYSENDGELQVAESTIGRTGLLRSVRNSLGGAFEMDYRPTARSYGDPHSRWLLAAVCATDGLAGDGPDTTLVTYAYAAPNYDRAERQFLGFGEVTTTQHLSPSPSPQERAGAAGEGARRVVRRYDNRSLYTRRCVTEETSLVRTAGGWDTLGRSRSEYTLKDPATGSALPAAAIESRNARIFVALTQKTAFNYEQPKGGGAGFKIMAKRERFAYDNYGNLTAYTETADGADVTAEITYAHREAAYLHALPARIGVSTDEGLLRERTAAYDERGNLTELKQNTSPPGATPRPPVGGAEGGGGVALNSFEYDAYGNITKATGPENYRGQRYWRAYEYDAALHAYPVRTEDAFGYASTAAYDPRWGAPLSVADLNGTEIRYEYDGAGRLTAVMASEATPSSPAPAEPALTFDYHLEAAVPYAHTIHHLTPNPSPTGEENKGAEVHTYTFCDGYGRPVQVKKSAVVAGEGAGAGFAGEAVMVLSGKAVYDAFGRTVAVHQATQEPPGRETQLTPLDALDAYPTRTDYDAKDRALKTTLPDGAVTGIRYSVGTTPQPPIGGAGLCLVQEVTDALGAVSEAYTDARGRQVAILRKTNTTAPPAGVGGNVLVQFIYNPLGELLRTIDPAGHASEFAYDGLGRTVFARHPDGGSTDYTYDAAGNLTHKQTANLRAMGEGVAINYTYDYTRLHEVVYPKHVGNRVTYTYGAPGAAHYRAGRLELVQDGSGGTELFYDAWGNVTKTIRSVMASSSDLYTWVWGAAYDRWGRVRQMTYPDGEQVTYTYNAAGELYAMSGAKDGRDYKYIDALGYDRFGQLVYQRLGNGVESRWAYEPERLRLQETVIASPALRDEAKSSIMQLHYSYDAVDNILSMTDKAAAPTQGLGGPVSHHYTYDDRYRLIAAAGTWTGAADSASYTLSMDYDIMGNPLRKAQSASGQPAVDSYELTYEYGGEKPNAPTQVGDRRYEYDANGNQSYWEDTTSKEYRQLLWDEENRLMAVDDNGYLSRYVYDHSGQRVVKAHGGLQGVYRNGAPVTPLQHAAKYTLYVSPYMTVTQDRFTKHYYAGNRRILSKNGTGVFNNMYRPGVAGVTAGGVNYFSRAAQIENAKNEYIKSLGIPPGPPTMKGIYAQPEYTGKGFPDSGTPVSDPPKGWPRKPVFNPPGGPPGPPIQWGDELTNETVEPGFGYIGTGAIPENDQYFYHPDHLGSTAYVTNITGAVCQFFVYLPYGEALVDKHSSPWKVPYTFSAKEQDAETKLTYFEARYYDSKYITFLSVDPMWAQKPWMTPYHYCSGNPIRFIDPTGLTEGEPDKDMNYTIQKGDNFWSLEKEWGLPHGTLEGINPSVDPTKLQVGQQINAAQRVGDFIMVGDGVTVPDQSIDLDFGQSCTPYGKIISAETMQEFKALYLTLSMWAPKMPSGGSRVVQGGRSIVSSTSQISNRAFFSGAGTEAKAIEKGFQTLSQTRAGQNLMKLTEGMPYYGPINGESASQAWLWWARLSSTYAKGIQSGSTVNVFLNNPSPTGIWNLVERPILQQRGVTMIVNGVK